jgi:hypothetical protein
MSGILLTEVKPQNGLKPYIHVPSSTLARRILNQLPVRGRYSPDELQSYAQAVDYKKIIGRARVCFLGEIHHSPAIRKEIVDLMCRLKEEGFTHFAMELFHSASQSYLDYYVEGKMSKEEVAEQEVGWHNHTKYYDDPNGSPPHISIYAPYFEIVDAAIKNNIKVVGIEWCRWDGGSISQHIQENFTQMGLTEKFLQEIRKEDGMHGSLMSELYYDIFEGHLPVRNWHAARVLTEILKTPGSRVAVLGGRGHYGYLSGVRGNFTLDNLLCNFSGVRGPVIHYAVFEKPKTSWNHQESPSLAKIVSASVRGNPIGQERFMLMAGESEEGNIDRPDIVIHLP